MLLVCSQPGCWNFFFNSLMILLQLRLRATIHMLVRAGPVWVIICFHLRIEPEFRFVSFLPFFFLFLKRRLSYVVIWQCLILIATTLGIK